MMAVVLSNQIAGFVAVPSEKKNIYVIRRPGGSYWEKLCPGRTQEQGHSSDAWEKKICLFQSTKFFKLLKKLFPVRLGK